MSHACHQPPEWASRQREQRSDPRALSVLPLAPTASTLCLLLLPQLLALPAELLRVILIRVTLPAAVRVAVGLPPARAPLLLIPRPQPATRGSSA